MSFFKEFKVRVFNWTVQRCNEYFTTYDKYNSQLEKFYNECDKNGLFRHSTTDQRVKELKESICTIKYRDIPRAYNSILKYVMSGFKINEDFINQDIDKDIERKKISLITRVNKVVGQITDANELRISGGEINGKINGTNGSAWVETITAGGYNIQCWHYRVLVKKVK